MFVYVLTALAKSPATRHVLDLVLSARVQDASRSVAALISDAEPGEAPCCADLCMVGGDLLLAQDRDEEAEEMYRLAVKRAAAGPRGLVRIVSGRNTGFLCLFQQRYATAAQCFQRVAEDASADPAQRVEALCGLAIATHCMGLWQRGLQLLDDASTVVRDECAATEMLAMLPDLLRVEMLVQRDLRSQTSLRDHAFWQLPPQGAVAASVPAASARAALAASRSTWERHELVRRRLGYLDALLQSAEGSVTAINSLPQHLATMRQSGLAACDRKGRVDAALAAVAVGNADLARAMMDALDARSGNGPAQRWSFEVSYCLSKVCELSGRTSESLMHYQRYAMDALQCVRTECRPESVARSVSPTEQVVRDDIEMSLPAKYRRAYRYMVEHLDRSTLTVREIAEHVGVTERALQNVFRKQLGMTPAEVLRRRRVEGIRGDLLAERCPGSTILEAGARWGIRNRSTLVNSYRRHFDETPGQTLQRQVDALAA